MRDVSSGTLRRFAAGPYTRRVTPLGGGDGSTARTVADPSARVLTLAGWSAGVVTTLLVIGSSHLVFGYHNEQLHLVLNTADTFVALLVAYLLLGRYLRSGRLQDGLLTAGLALLGVTGLGVTVAGAVLDDAHTGTLDVWLPLLIRLSGAGLIIAAAVLGPHPARPAAGVLRVVAVAVALGVIATVLARDALPVALDATSPASTEDPVITGHPLLVGGQAVSAACFLVASVFFTRQAVRRHDELLRWLGPACALAGFARVNYVLFPSLYSGWVYTGDFLRTAAYVLLLVGAAREIGRYWSAQARAAVLDDRSRLARELHDGVVQELGYIRSEAHGLDHDRAGQIVAACDRALDEARAAVDALGRSQDEPLGFVLHRSANQVAERYGGRIDVQLDDSVTADQEQRHALVRITREAVSNALRHGGADRVCIHLARDESARRLVVEDSGRGFDPAAVRATATGYGLTSMAERARGLRGTFRVDSAPGKGTRIEVTW